MSQIKIDIDGVLGLIILNSPATLNSLSHEDILAIKTGLDNHEKDTSVKAIIIKSSTDKAFCAGGDMKQIHRNISAANFDAINHFFVDEYALNLAISECTKPYIAVMHGITMGGGMGVSVHGTHRIVTETSLLAMPESRIGFFPDVGASYFLPRLPYRAGYWMGLAATSIGAAEGLTLGLATHYIKSDDLGNLNERLNTSLSDQSVASGQTTHQLVQTTLDTMSSPMANADVLNTLKQREIWFADNDAKAIERRLSGSAAGGGTEDSSADAQHLLDLLLAGSPHSTDITLELFAAAEGKTLAQCLELELALCAKAVRHPDCAEGVRAVLVDKDKSPKWAALR